MRKKETGEGTWCNFLKLLVGRQDPQSVGRNIMGDFKSREMRRKGKKSKSLSRNARKTGGP